MKNKKEIDKCPKCGSQLWRDEHPDGYAVGKWNCSDCNWYEGKKDEKWEERFRIRYTEDFQGNKINLSTEDIKSFIRDVLEEQKQLILDSFPKRRGKTIHHYDDIYYNQALDEVEYVIKNI